MAAAQEMEKTSEAPTSSRRISSGRRSTTQAIPRLSCARRLTTAELGRIQSGSMRVTEAKSWARVLASGRVGRVLRYDPEDGLLTYKLRFADGVLPYDDWYAREMIEPVIVETPKEGDLQFHEIGSDDDSDLEADGSGKDVKGDGGEDDGWWSVPFGEFHVIASLPGSPEKTSDAEDEPERPRSADGIYDIMVSPELLRVAATKALRRSRTFSTMRPRNLSRSSTAQGNRKSLCEKRRSHYYTGPL
eukprot:TRINITY_DN48997_c0_g1_i1.p1 TRINITY_DN48997_c0_g1~~TRINITY_DN48997_c0_g1_i1.p1  ORF type:complete len:246 (-),score=42.61 TRINITY_DN48997_c0_g1_i1:30-767(-)